MSTRMNEGDWAHTLEVFGCLPRRGRKACERSSVPGTMHFLRWRTCAGCASGALRPLEFRVEALRPAEQGRRVRGLLRHAGFDEHVGASEISRCSIPPSCAPMSRRRPATRGQNDQASAARAAGSRRKSMPNQMHREHDRVRPDRRRESRRAALLHLPRHRTDIAPRAAIGDKGVCQQGEPGRRTSQRHRPGHTYKTNEKGEARVLRKASSTRARARIVTGNRRSQTLQAGRPFGARRRPATMDPSSASQQDYA